MLILQTYVSDKGADDKAALAAICREPSQWHGYYPSVLKLIDEYKWPNLPAGVNFPSQLRVNWGICLYDGPVSIARKLRL